MDPVTVVGSALSLIGDGIEAIAPAAFLVGAGLVGLKVGWAIARRLVVSGLGSGGVADYSVHGKRCGCTWCT